jgi:hypothetical protein
LDGQPCLVAPERLSLISPRPQDASTPLLHAPVGPVEATLTGSDTFVYGR